MKWPVRVPVATQSGFYVVCHCEMNIGRERKYHIYSVCLSRQGAQTAVLSLLFSQVDVVMSGSESTWAALQRLMEKRTPPPGSTGGPTATAARGEDTNHLQELFDSIPFETIGCADNPADGCSHRDGADSGTLSEAGSTTVRSADSHVTQQEYAAHHFDEAEEEQGKRIGSMLQMLETERPANQQPLFEYGKAVSELSQTEECLPVSSLEERDTAEVRKINAETAARINERAKAVSVASRDLKREQQQLVFRRNAVLGAEKKLQRWAKELEKQERVLMEKTRALRSRQLSVHLVSEGTLRGKEGGLLKKEDVLHKKQLHLERKETQLAEMACELDAQVNQRREELEDARKVLEEHRLAVAQELVAREQALAVREAAVSQQEEVLSLLMSSATICSSTSRDGQEDSQPRCSHVTIGIDVWERFLRGLVGNQEV